jgi:transcriptional regulator with XRE-family HTH domain
LAVNGLPNLRRSRELEGLSQRDLAARAGIGRDTIARLELGRGRPFPSTVTRLARALRCRPRDLLLPDAVAE